MTDDGEKDELTTVAARIRASYCLGRSDTLHRLFDYLLQRTLQGEPPKEIEIASDVFGKSTSDLLVDASVRVYVHRLRKKIDDYYLGPGQGDTERLSLPKGEYRFHLHKLEADAAPIVETGSAAAMFFRRYDRWLFLLLGLLAGGALVWAAILYTTPNDGLASVRTSKVWSSLMTSRRALIMVPGDYYIMGERDKGSTDPSRLVREFQVNSREELDEWFMREPALKDHYVDLNLYYLPVSTGYALKTIMPIVSPSLVGGRTSWLVPSSKLTANLLKDGDIVYAGLLSGLGLLQQAVFSNSRFAFAGSFDEIVDSDTGKIYVADPPRDTATARRNYAYVAKLPGPNGNTIIIVAGTRDPAVLQAVDILNSPAELKKLADTTKSEYFEALYAVDGVGDGNLRGTLIAASPRSAEGMWDAALDSGNAP